MDIIAKNLSPENFRPLGHKLKFSDGEIDQFRFDHEKLGFREVIYQMLLAWQQREHTDATLGILCTKLYDLDCIDIIKELHTETKSS